MRWARLGWSRVSVRTPIGLTATCFQADAAGSRAGLFKTLALIDSTTKYRQGAPFIFAFFAEMEGHAMPLFFW